MAGASQRSRLCRSRCRGRAMTVTALRLFARSFAVCLGVTAAPALADSQFLSLTPTYLPTFVGFGVGMYPDYVGSDDAIPGIAPIARYALENQRYLSLEVNYATANLLTDRNWRAGPAGLLRFGRDEDVEDEVVALLPEIDPSVELGAFLGYETVGADPRDRWSIYTNFTHGVTGDNDGYTVAASLRRWMPVGRFSALGLAVGTTYGSDDYMDTYFSVDAGGAAASGLPVFRAGSGVRDVRVTAVFIQPLSREWQVGAGFLYSRLLNDAADSPVVSDRGDRNQLVFGIGVTRAF